MKILLSNDDGIHAAGIRALAEALRPHHDIVMVAPDSERSGSGHSCTFTEPIFAREISLPGLEDVKAYLTNGTPADCVSIGCNGLGLDIDLVVSGINHGANLGTHLFYSGTVGAAMEGVFCGKPAIATSSYSWRPVDFSAAALATLWAVDYVERNPLPKGVMLNLNTPELPASEIKGIKLAGLHMQHADVEYVDYTDPYSRRYFWMKFKERSGELENEGDEYWARKGYATLTPIHYDIAYYKYMEKMDLSDFDILTK